MYISKIDDLIDNVIDDFYVNVIMKDKQLIKIFKEPNFVKFQAEINNIIKNYIGTINLKEIKELVKSNEAFNAISEIVKRYIAFYLFLTIGFNYQSKLDTYINNIVEFTKNQPEYNFKIDNFFNSESNSLIIKYNNMLRNILVLLDADQQKIDILKIKPDYKEVILFLNELGIDYIDKYIRLAGVKGNKHDQCHYMIKTIIVLLLYKTNEKKEIFRLLEMTEHIDEEYMFIDIVIPKQQYIDYSSVEQLIGSKPEVKSLSNYFWNFLKDYEETLLKSPETPDEKISALIQSGILTPICDDFLLYHKDSERYDRTLDPSKIKKKEDTKIRYIINKIDSVTEYYSEQVRKDEKIKSNVKKQFYIPLSSRKAVLINNNEDTHIINKFLNQGKRSVENNEYFNDLMHYKSYPYINFKDFENAGFPITLSKTIDIVRYISLDTDAEFKQRNKNNYLQMRIGSKDMIVNVVGFMISTNINPIQCVKINKSVDIRSLSKNTKNGKDLMLAYLKESTLGTASHGTSVYWLFDTMKDSNIKNADKNVDNMSKTIMSDQIKNIVSSLYDEILNELYYVVVDELEKRENLNIQIAHKILNMVEKKIIKISRDSELYEKIETKIYELIEKVENEYDKNEDVLHGIHGNIISLPVYKKSEKNKIQLININISNIGEYGARIDETPHVDGVCQHNITWDKISSIHNKNPKLYMDQMYSFVQQYVIENVDQDYICKSCGTQLNIKKYITDGEYDDATQKFVTYSMPMDIPLEDIQEYEKYKISIRNIDKIIEKIANISNIPHLIKSSVSVKWKRKTIVKDAIDLLINNNKILKKTFKERNELASKTYGINRDLSSFFIFELENSIFVFSSKDKDHYKPIKQNNILAYLIFLIALEINDSHVLFIGGDKKGLCNIQVFDKIYKSLFGDLKIRINNVGDTSNITNYKVLCYIIYILGCYSIKYKMWYHEQKEDHKKKYDPIIQKIVAHTIVDIINSVLEIASQPNPTILYEMLSVKTFKKLTGTFSNESIYENLKNEEKTNISENKSVANTNVVKLIELSGNYKQMKYEDVHRNVCKTSKFYMTKNVRPYIKYYNVNNITNCSDGQFHEWKPNGSIFVCNLCKFEASTINYDVVKSKNITHNFKFVRLGKLSEKLCYVDGTAHQFIQNESGAKICLKCNKSIDHTYTQDELDKLSTALDGRDEIVNTNIIKQKEKIVIDNEKELSYVQKVVDNVEKSYGEFGNNFGFIDTLINEMQNIIGNETGTGTGIYLKENSYVINHDHLGFDLDNAVIITDSKKIYFKENHPFFKNDVIYYSSHKNGKIEIFYDTTTKILLGYKEESKNFVHNKKQDKRLIINYSIANKLKLLGYTSQFIDISTNYDNQLIGREDLNINKDQLNVSIVLDIMRDRISNLKRIVYEFQRILFRLLNNFNQTLNEDDDSDYFSNIMNSLIIKYKKKLNEIKLIGDKGEHSVFKHWKGIDRGIFTEELKQVKFNFENHKILNTDDVNKIDKNGNIVLYFIVKEFTKLIQYNQNKFIKSIIVTFMIDFINTAFDLFNTEKISNNLDIKRFYYLLNSQTYVNEIVEKSGVKNVEGIYGEYIDDTQEVSQEEKDHVDDTQEEQDALDVESIDEEEFIDEYDKSQDRETIL